MTTTYPTPSLGIYSKISLNGVPYAFTSETLTKHQQQTERESLRGTRERSAADVAVTQEAFVGDVVIEPSATELPVLFALAMPGEDGTLPTFDVVVVRDFRGDTYQACRVNRFRLRGHQGDLLTVTLELVAMSWTGGGAVADPASSLPLVFPGTVLTIATVARDAVEVDLEINNNLLVRYAGTLGPSQVREGLRDVAVQATVTWSSDNADLVALAVAGAAGRLQIGSTTAGDPPVTTSALDLTFGALQTPNDHPTVPGRGEIPLRLVLAARKSAAGVDDIAMTTS